MTNEPDTLERRGPSQSKPEITSEGTTINLEPKAKQEITPPFGKMYFVECNGGDGRISIGDDCIFDFAPGEKKSGINTFCEVTAGEHGISFTVTDVSDLGN